MKKILLTCVLAVAELAAQAQKQIYIPYEWKNNSSTYKESDPQNTAQYSKSRSKENDNFIVYWEKGYGNTAPNELSKSDPLYVDIDDLLKQADYLYDTYVNKLKFCDEATSNVSKYKMIICLLHTEEWVATGSGYDNVIGALWVNPGTCKPVGHTIGHEIGHSFQYQSFCDHSGYAGFRTAIGNGSTFWEQTAQWQAAISYPGPRWSESWFNFYKVHNYAMTHEWFRYQSYWWHYYLTEKYGIDFIGKLWQHDTGKGQDPNEVLMHMLGIDATELYKMYFEYAMKMATIDINYDNLNVEGINQIKSTPYRYDCIALTNKKYQVAYYSTPQSTGFNIIPLTVPEAGSTVSIDFTSLKQRAKLAEGDNAEYFNGDKDTKVSGTKTYYNVNSKYGSQRGFRLGYVALLKDGSRQYLYEDSLYCAEGGTGEKTVTVTATVPANTESLYFVVSPAPKEYIQHQWDEDITNDDQWPYTIELNGVEMINAPEPYVAPTISDELPVTDATITYDVNLPVTSNGLYTALPVNVKGETLAALGTAFQMENVDLESHLTAWSSAAVTEGQMKFYAINPTTGAIVNQGSSANGYGHWFNASGSRSDWGSGYLYSEFQPATLTFNVGPFPDKLTTGKTIKIGQAIQYKKDGKTATVNFIFNVTAIDASATGSYSVADIKQDPIVEEYIDKLTVIRNLQSDNSSTSTQHATPVSYYTISGTQIAEPQKGVNLVKYSDGRIKKAYLK